MIKPRPTRRLSRRKAQEAASLFPAASRILNTENNKKEAIQSDDFFLCWH